MSTLVGSPLWGAPWGAFTWGFDPTSGGGPSNQTVTPTAIATGQSMATPYIVIPGIEAGFIPSQQAMGSPSIVGGTVTLDIATIPTPRVMGTPNVGGPISPGFVPSQQSFGTVYMGAEQGISPDSVPSLQSMGTPDVFHVLDIAPGSAPSRQSMGTPSIMGGSGSVLPFAVPSQQAMGYPTMVGGGTGLTVYVGGVVWGGNVLILGASDTTAPVSYESSNPPTITSQTIGRWVLNLDLSDDTGMFAPTRGQTILITEGGAKRFAGCIQTVQRTLVMGTEGETGGGFMLYHVTATDKSGICDRRIVKAITYPAGTDIGTVIGLIVASSLNGEGITITPASVPNTGSLGALSADLVINYSSVTSVFNSIATDGGLIWYVDTNGILWFNPFTSLQPAPWSISPTSNDYRSMVVEETNIDYANSIYAISNLNVLPGSGTGTGGGGGAGAGSNTETFVTTSGNIGVVFQISPVDGMSYPYAINVSLPIGTLYSVSVNGVNQDQIVNITQWDGEIPTSSPQYGPWLWGPNGTTVSAGIVGPAGLPIGATVVINYTPYSTNTAALIGNALAPIDPATGGTLGTCGSGRYELAVQVKNVSTTDNLNAIAAAELVKRNGLPVTVHFQTDRPGLQPGQLLTVDRPAIFLDNQTFLIIRVVGVAQPLADLGYGSSFRWEVTAQSNEDPGNFLQYFASMIQQSANALPVYQYEDASYQLGNGSSFAGGTAVLSPYLVKRTGQLAFIYAACGTPPTNQNLQIQFLVNGNPIPGTLTIPGGSSPNTPFSYTFPLNNPLFVFNTATENDVITISAQYVVTGANPTPAANISTYLRWRI